MYQGEYQLVGSEMSFFTRKLEAEAAAFFVPDDRLGEEVGAAVHLLPGQSLTEDALRDFLKEHLAGYKTPRYLWFSDSQLPRNASGKFLKKDLQKVLRVEEAL